MKTIIFGKQGFVGRNLNMGCICPTKYECDLLDYESVRQFFSIFSSSEKIKIINLAAKVAGATYNVNHNIEMLYYNSLMVLNIIRAIKEFKLNVYYLYISSICSYDNSNIMSEDLFFNGNPSANNFGYGIAKKLGVSALQALKYDMPNFKFGVLIPTNMYGEYDEKRPEYSHVIPALYYKMRTNPESINVFGNANNVRNFLYVRNMCDVISMFARNEIEEICNVSSDESLSIKRITEIIADITKYKGELQFNFDGRADIRNISNDKLKSVYKQHGENLSFTRFATGLILSSDYYSK